MKNITIGALVAAILVAFGLNKCEVPAEVAETIKVATKTVVKRDTIYVPVEKTVANTKYIDKIRVIRDSADTWAKEFLLRNNDSLRKDRKQFEVAVFKKLEDCVTAAEAIQNENELLVEDKNSLVDILAQTTNELWIEKNKPLPKDSLGYKKFKHGLSASYGVLIGSKPIYQLIYEKPLTPALSLTGGVMWNGKPGVNGGIKIMF